MTRAANPIVLSSSEVGDIGKLAERIHAKCEYFLIGPEHMRVALIARDDLDEYLEWREEYIQDLDEEEDAEDAPAELRRVPIREIGDLQEIAKRIYLDNECFVLEQNVVLPVAFVHPVDLDIYLEWRKFMEEALAESEQDAREGRTRPATELLEDLKREAGSGGNEQNRGD